MFDRFKGFFRKNTGNENQSRQFVLHQIGTIISRAELLTARLDALQSIITQAINERENPIRKLALYEQVVHTVAAPWHRPRMTRGILQALSAYNRQLQIAGWIILQLPLEELRRDITTLLASSNLDDNTKKTLEGLLGRKELEDDEDEDESELNIEPQLLQKTKTKKAKRHRTFLFSKVKICAAIDTLLKPYTLTLIDAAFGEMDVPSDSTIVIENPFIPPTQPPAKIGYGPTLMKEDEK